MDFEQLLDVYAGPTTVGRGDVTGTLSLGGRNIQSLNDLKGRFQLNLGGTDATAVPGLSSAGVTTGALSLTGVRFTDGVVKGQIANGAIGIEQLALLSDRAKVTASGRVSLVGGRMDLRGLIETGNFEAQSILLGAVAPLALNSVVPLGAVNQALSDRAAVVDLTGTIQDPQLRIVAAETIQANVRRRLISGATRLILVESALNTK